MIIIKRSVAVAAAAADHDHWHLPLQLRHLLRPFYSKWDPNFHFIGDRMHPTMKGRRNMHIGAPINYLHDHRRINECAFQFASGQKKCAVRFYCLDYLTLIIKIIYSVIPCLTTEAKEVCVIIRY